MGHAAIYNEIDPYAADWLDNLIRDGLIAPGRVDRRSISDLTPADVAGPGQRHFFAGIGAWSYALRLAGVPDDADIWTGSCPCQGLSDAGKRLGALDPRHLWPAWFALIAECRPPILFGEQVASRLGLGWLDLVFSDLERCGYTVGAADLCAASVGAPHARQRLYFVAHAGERGREILRTARLHDHRQPRHDTLGRGTTGVVADATSWTGGQRLHRESQGSPDERREPTGTRGQRDASEGSPGRAVGDADRPGFAGTEGGPGSGRIGGPVATVEARDAGGGETRSLGDSGSDRTGQHPGELPSDEAQHEVRTENSHHASVDPSATRGFWADAEWLPCIDGVSRPAKPGTFPLAHGTSGRMVVRRASDEAADEEHWYNRVGALRGIGNVIVSQVAAAFITCAIEAIGQDDDPTK